ncbi:Recombination endonuclease VII [uncultured Caudovirales phage]|uniref:Recombination endonuclease VII n=1 Tax=uncultured Caudovirales phage TaxID=2100421 RepID=A0A6J5L2A6_9CAUD|nr:Recombination endonuclease VII [uncultured Caudovirales phage]CAB4134440.1 Recombination endonuclease VII [uncultured Caudovirales phage]
MSIVKHCKIHGDLTIEKTCNVHGNLSTKDIIIGFNDDRPYYTCRLCRNERARKYRLENPEKFSATKKKCWYKHHEKNIVESREKYQKHKDVRQKDSLDRYHANPKAQSNRRLKRLFGLSQNEYDAMIIAQDNKCAICKNSEMLMDNKQLDIRKLAVDHCHVTNKVRGLLCFNCNIGLGKFKDSIDELQNAIDYLLIYT